MIEQSSLLSSEWVSYTICGVIGGATGIIELVSRYKDDPISAIRCNSAIVYIAVNIIASLISLLLLKTFAAELLGPSGDSATIITEILVAGLGAMGFLRTSIFNISVASERVAVGPAALLEVLLSAADRAVDRQRASARATAVDDMGWDCVSYKKAKVALPAYCFALMQNVSAKEQTIVSKHINTLEGDKLSTLTSKQKLRLVVLALMNVVGETVLKEAKDGLGKEIEGDDDKEDQEARKKLQEKVNQYKKNKAANEADRGNS